MYPPIKPDSHLKFHKLRFGSEIDNNGNTVVTRWDIDKTISANKEAVALIKLLSSDWSLGKASEKLDLSSENAKEIVKLCLDMGFVSQIDGQVLEEKFPKTQPILTFLNKRYLSWLVSIPFGVISFAFIVSAVAIVFTHRHYLPNYLDFFWTNDYLVVIFSSEIIAILSVALHEFSHFLTAKAVGAQARIKLNNRYLDLVVETEQYHLNLAPKNKRYIVYLSGMYFDMIVIAAIFWLYFLSDFYKIDLGIARKLMPLVLLINLEGIVWEFSAFLETDMYNFLSDFLNQDNLYLDTKKYLSLRLHNWQTVYFLPLKKVLTHTVLRKANLTDANDQREMDKTQRKQIKIYSMFLVGGIALTTTTFIFIGLPMALIYLFGNVNNLFIAVATGNWVEGFKAILVLILVTYSDLLLTGILFKKVLRHESII